MNTELNLVKIEVNNSLVSAWAVKSIPGLYLTTTTIPTFFCAFDAMIVEQSPITRFADELQLVTAYLHTKLAEKLSLSELFWVEEKLLTLCD